MDFSKYGNLQFSKIAFSPLQTSKKCAKPVKMEKILQDYKKTVKNDIWNTLDNGKTMGSMFFRQSWRKNIGQIRFSKKMLRPTSDSNVHLLNTMKQVSQLIYIYRRT